MLPFTTILKNILFSILIISPLNTVIAQDQNSNEDVIPAKIYVIPLREDVDRYLGVFLGRSIEAAKAAEAEIIILEIDTFGGRVDTALEIANKIGAANFAKTVAYIPSDSGGRGVSWSAGALMAFSTSEIWMSPGTSMGAAAPVYQTSEGMQAAEEKTVSAVRGQMAALAEKNGHPIQVALAMVDSDIILKEVTIDGKEILATAAEIDDWERNDKDYIIGQTISDKGKLLTLTAGQMERYNVSEGTVSDLDELIESLGYTTDDVLILEKSGSDSILTLLTSAAVTSLLLIAGLVALYLEITSPGFGIPGTIALICFAVVFGASGLMGTLGPIEILLFLIGVTLLLLEIFLIPGFGIAGISGIVLILLSLVFSRQDFYWPQFDWQWTIVRRSLGIVGMSVIGGILSIGVIMAALPRVSLFDRIILKDPGDPGYAGKSRRRRRHNKDTAADKESVTASTAIEPGSIGVAVTDLRPVGKIKINKDIFVAETDGEYYSKGTNIIVQRYDGFKIIVSAEEV